LLHLETPIKVMEEAKNRPQKANDSSCTFLQWHNRRLACGCLCNWYRLWRGVDSSSLLICFAQFIITYLCSLVLMSRLCCAPVNLSGSMSYTLLLSLTELLKALLLLVL